MNNCVFVGRLTDNPEIRYANNEAKTAVARMCIAVERPVRKGEEKKADFFRCICFGQRAEFAANYLKKGKRIAVQGRMQNESFEGKDGNTVRYTELLANEINFADGREDAEEEKKDGQPGGKANSKTAESKKGNPKAKTASAANAARAKQADKRFLEAGDDDEELPFH